MRSLVHSCPGEESVVCERADTLVRIISSIKSNWYVIWRWAKWCLTWSDTLTMGLVCDEILVKLLWSSFVIILHHCYLPERATHKAVRHTDNPLPTNVATSHATVSNQYALHSEAINEASYIVCLCWVDATVYEIHLGAACVVYLWVVILDTSWSSVDKVHCRVHVNVLWYNTMTQFHARKLLVLVQ